MIQHNKSYSNKVKLFFDNTDNYLKNNYNISLRKNIIKTLIGSKKGRSILDVGCGKAFILYEIKKIKNCAIYAKKNNLEVHAGHGLDYKSTQILSKINQIEEFNIGHFLIGEAIFDGLPFVIKKFKRILR